MKKILLSWISCIIFVAFLHTSIAPPRPITDNESDESEEFSSYKYPDFKKAENPYWNAFPEETRKRLKLHDHLELNVLRSLRELDFKTRESWTITDQPFYEDTSSSSS